MSSVPSSWTERTRDYLGRRLPATNLLPDRQPYYVGSWVYIFGVVTIAALAWVILSGVVLAFFGPQWWHLSAIGRFFNGLHFWSVQLFFIFMVLHLWGQYFAAGWRDGRAKTWMAGVLIFLVSIVAAFTGYVSQQNFDAQWISTQAKDAMNAAGIGSFFNLLNFGQMYSYHVLLLPAVVVGIVVAHVLLVRKHGVVPPFRVPSNVEKTRVEGSGLPDSELSS